MFEQDIAELKERGFKLRGSAIIAELLPAPEVKTASGLIISAPSDHVRGNSVNAHKLEVAKVLDVGPGVWDDESRTYLPLDIHPGQVIILNQYSYNYISLLPGITKPLSNKLVIVPSNGILASYPDERAYEGAIASRPR
jgi:co-chaperonin GroES (HSP10)